MFASKGNWYSTIWDCAWRRPCKALDWLTCQRIRRVLTLRTGGCFVSLRIGARRSPGITFTIPAADTPLPPLFYSWRRCAFGAEPPNPARRVVAAAFDAAATCRSGVALGSRARRRCRCRHTRIGNAELLEIAAVFLRV